MDNPPVGLAGGADRYHPVNRGRATPNITASGGQGIEPPPHLRPAVQADGAPSGADLRAIGRTGLTAEFLMRKPVLDEFADMDSPYQETALSYEKPKGGARNDGALADFINGRTTAQRAKLRAIHSQYRTGAKVLVAFIQKHAAHLATGVNDDLKVLVGRVEAGVREGTGNLFSTSLEGIMGDGKRAFDIILALLDNEDISLGNKIDEVANMAHSVIVCGAGTGANMQLHAQKLRNSIGGIANHARLRWEEMFYDTVTEYVDKRYAHEAPDDLELMHQHYVNALVKELGGAWGIHANSDDGAMPPAAEAADACRALLEKKMTAANLLGALADECLSEIHRVFGTYRGEDLPEVEQVRLRAEYENKLAGQFEKNYGGIDDSIVMNEYHCPRHDGETYTLIDSRALLMRQIARNFRAELFIENEKFKTVGASTAKNQDKKTLKELGPHDYYVKGVRKTTMPAPGGTTRTFKTAYYHPVRVDDLVPPKTEGQAAPAPIIRFTELPEGVTGAALRNTSNADALARLPFADVIRFVNADGYDNWLQAYTSPEVKRYRASCDKEDRDGLQAWLEEWAGNEDTEVLFSTLTTAIKRDDPDLVGLLLPFVPDATNRLASEEKIGLMHFAASNGMYDFLTQTLSTRPRAAEDLDGDRRTPFMAAAMAGDVEAMKLLFSVDPSTSTAIDRDERVAFALAARSGQCASLRHMIEEMRGVPLDDIDTNQMTPLMLAIQAGHLEAAHVLLEAAIAHPRTFNLERRDKDGETALTYAARHLPFAIAPLIQAGANPNGEPVEAGGTRRSGERHAGVAHRHHHRSSHRPEARTSRRGEQRPSRTPIQVAAAAGKAQSVSALINAGATVEPARGEPPLWIAAKAGHAEVVRVLIESDASDAGIACIEHVSNGTTPLQEAAREGRAGIVKILVTVGANVRARDAGGNTALHLALAAGHKACALELLENDKIEFDSRNTAGERPLALAAAMGDAEVLAKLLEKGATLELPDSVGRTALVHAVKAGSEACVRLLLDKGAIPYNSSGRTSLLEIATRDGHAEIATILRAAMALFERREAELQLRRRHTQETAPSARRN